MIYIEIYFEISGKPLVNFSDFVRFLEEILDNKIFSLSLEITTMTEEEDIKAFDSKALGRFRSIRNKMVYSD